MPEPSVPPPLKVFQVGGSSYIPVFELELSGGTVTKQSPIRVRYMPTSTTGVAASRLISTTAPLAGGGDLSVDRTHTLDTAAMVTSGRSLSTLYPISGGGDLSANRTLSVDTAFLVTTARQILTVFPASGGGSLSADQTIAVSTGGFLVLSSRAINTTAPLAGGGNLSADRTFTIDTLAVATSGRNFIVFATEAQLPNSKVLVANTYVTVTTSATQTIISSSAKTIRVPMALATVAPDSSNAFWSVKSGTTVDQGYVAFADSGLGWATWQTVVPYNLAATPNWGLFVYNSPNAGNGTVCIVSLSARLVSAGGSIDTAYSNLVSVGTIFAQTAGILGIGTTTATSFDSTITLSGGSLLFVEMTRHAQLVADTLNAQWNVYQMALQCDVV